MFSGAPEGSELESVLTLVDLAGSERASKSVGDTARLKEGVSINKSLSVLGYVIMKLSEGVEQSGGHIPYRDSKLTRILQVSHILVHADERHPLGTDP
jgi:centromeric protein E